MYLHKNQHHYKNSNNTNGSRAAKSSVSLSCLALYLGLLLVITTGCSLREQPVSDTAFIKGELTLASRQQALLPTTDSQANTSVWGTVSPSRTTPQTRPRDYVLGLAEPLSSSQLTEQLLAGKATVRSQLSEKTFSIRFHEQQEELEDLVQQLTSRPEVAYLEPDYPVLPQAVPPADPEYSRQWNLHQLQLETVWKQGHRGSDRVTVAVIDTGITEHEDLLDNVSFQEGHIYGRDLISDDYQPLDTGPNFKHGTHVAGIIAASTNNDTGIAGINWELDLLPVRVIGPEGGTTSTLAEGIKWAADNGAHIINLSLAALNTDSEPQVLREAVEHAHEQEVLMIAASGNDGLSSLSYPARFPEVLSVGALDHHGQRAYFSNYGPGLDLMAPGVDIISTTGDDSYQPASGTSMATPHVTGLAALLYARGITDPEQLRGQLLTTTAEHDGSSEEYGAGPVSFTGALELEEKQSKTFSGSPKIKARNLEDSRTEILALEPDEEGRFIIELPGGKWQLTIWLADSNSRQPESAHYQHTIEEVNLEQDTTHDLGAITLK